jgi:4-hydroxy-tetrahydrodipicolinate synthase
VALLKAEGPPLEIHALIEAAGGAFDVFNGRNGLDLIESLHAGCAGLIPGVETCDMQARIYDLVRAGEAEEAERLFRDILPVLTSVMQSIEHLICYGKPLAARRIGLGAVHRRSPTQAPTPFGSALVARWARHLPDF